MNTPISEKENGIKIEYEHKPTLEKLIQFYDTYKKFPDLRTFAEWIYNDHVNEYPTYYNFKSGLPAMEYTLETEEKTGADK